MEQALESDNDSAIKSEANYILSLFRVNLMALVWVVGDMGIIFGRYFKNWPHYSTYHAIVMSLVSVTSALLVGVQVYNRNLLTFK